MGLIKTKKKAAVPPIPLSLKTKTEQIRPTTGKKGELTMSSVKTPSYRSRRALAMVTLLAAVNLLWSAATYAELTFADNGQGLSLPLPSGYASSLGEIAVQIDGYDVSHFVRVSESTIDVSMDAPVEPGPHSLQILLIGNDGSISTLLDTSATFETDNNHPVDWEANATFSHTYLADDKNFPEDADKHHSNGGMEAQLVQSRDSWNWQGSVSALYDSNSDNDSDLNEWAIAQYRLAAEAQGEHINSGLTLGHVQANRESLLFSSFERRGLAAHFRSADEAHSFDIFAMRSDATSRYDGSLSVPGNSDIRSVGGESSVTLIDEQLLLSVAYVDGNTDQGVTDPDLRRVFGGDAWNAAIDAYAFSQKLWFHAEYAESDFDSDGLQEGEASKSDSATQAVLQWSSDESGLSLFDYWRAQLRYQEVGPEFYSIGNLSLPGDISLHQGRLEGGTDTLSVSLDISREQTNVDDQADKATQTLDITDISVAYSPYIEQESRTWRILGAPSLSAGLTQADHSQPRSDSIAQGFDLDQRSLESRIELTFNAERYNWGVSAHRVDLEDKSTRIIQGTETIYEPGSDQLQESFGMNGGWQPNNRLVLNLFAQWSRLKEKDFNNTYDSSNFGIDGQYLIIPETLDLVMSYNHGIESSDFGDPGYLDGEFQNSYGSAKLSWHCLQARDRRPGLVSYLNGVWNRQQDKTLDSSDEDWAIYIGLDLLWAASGSI